MEGGREEGRERATWKSSTADCCASERRASSRCLQRCRRRAARCLQRCQRRGLQRQERAVCVAVCGTVCVPRRNKRS
eukprot:687590-Rhodomonas_salina.1